MIFGHCLTSISTLFPVQLLNPDGRRNSPPPASPAVHRGRSRGCRGGGRCGRRGRALPAQLSERVPARVRADRAGHEPRELPFWPALIRRQGRRQCGSGQVSEDRN